MRSSNILHNNAAANELMKTKINKPKYEYNLTLCLSSVHRCRADCRKMTSGQISNRRDALITGVLRDRTWRRKTEADPEKKRNPVPADSCACVHTDLRSVSALYTVPSHSGGLLLAAPQETQEGGEAFGSNILELCWNLKQTGFKVVHFFNYYHRFEKIKPKSDDEFTLKSQ